MKRIVSFVFLMAVLAGFCTGCDFIRASLGKPTSKDLVKISDELKAREQYLRDSVAAVRAAQAAAAGEAAQIPADQPLAQPTGQPVEQPAAPVARPAASVAQPVANPATQTAGQPLKTYYAVAGAFKNPEGVKKYVALLEENGLTVHLFDFKSGLTVVCLEGHDVFGDAQKDLIRLKELKLSDSDPWIYNTNQKLHK